MALRSTNFGVRQHRVQHTAVLLIDWAPFLSYLTSPLLSSPVEGHYDTLPRLLRDFNEIAIMLFIKWHLVLIQHTEMEQSG